MWIDTSEGYTAFDARKNVTCVKVKRGSDSIDIDQIQFLFYTKKGTQEKFRPSFKTNSQIPQKNEGKVYCFNHTSEKILTPPTKIAIAALLSSGKLTNILSEIRIPESNLYSLDKLDFAQILYYPPISSNIGIIPQPKQVYKISKEKIKLNNSWSIYSEDEFAPQYINSQTTLDLEIKQSLEENQIIIGNPETNSNIRDLIPEANLSEIQKIQNRAIQFLSNQTKYLYYLKT